MAVTDGKVVALEERRSAREPERRLFFCVACGSYSFKIIGLPDGDFIGCANCEAWINEFELQRTREDI